MDKHALAKHKTITLECTINNNVETLPEDTIGNRVKKQRLSNKLTIKDLEKFSNISLQTIINIEKNRTTPSITTLNKLSKALNTSNLYLLGAKDWSENNPGQKIKKYRIINGLSQRQLAKLCNLHQSTIKDYEDGKISNPRTLKTIYGILEIK